MREENISSFENAKRETVLRIKIETRKPISLKKVTYIQVSTDNRGSLTW